MGTDTTSFELSQVPSAKDSLLWLHAAWQIRVTTKMLNLFLTLKIVEFLTGFDP